MSWQIGPSFPLEQSGSRTRMANAIESTTTKRGSTYSGSGASSPGHEPVSR